MSGQITGGTVRIEETKQIADYQPRKAVVELHFSAEDARGAEAILDHASDLAVKKVAELLGKPAPAAAKTEGGETKAAKPPGRPPKPKTEPEKTNGAAAAAADDLPTDTKIETKPKAEPAADDLSDLGVETAAPQITDQDLMSKISAHNHKSKNPVAIRQLIAKQFADPTGKKAQDIPQEKRAAFIEALHQIPAA